MKNLFIELLKNSKHENLNDLYVWLLHLVNNNTIEIFYFEEDEYTYDVRIIIYTSKYSYHISAKFDAVTYTDYLLCASQCRERVPGEDWFRGNDMTDGPFSTYTWNKILNSIVRNELEQISTYITEEKSASFENFMNNLGGGINICSASTL